MSFVTGKGKRSKMQWYRMDLHIHTPASLDYQEPDISYLDILRKAELRHLDIIAFTDHNTVKGYARMIHEIELLEYLVQLGRAEAEEIRRLKEYRRLLDKVLVLPGFEFTATLGFHILCLFSPQTPVRQIEHILLSLRVPPEIIEEGNPATGASSDVLTCYRLVNEAGGIVIAAHANSTHGVAMRGFDFGGQTRIAYTQDEYLHALEVTDLDKKGRNTTARFFDGSKPEYPRRMRCIQGSDAHRLSADLENPKNLGIGDRITESLLAERSFDGLLAMFQTNDFARTRPYQTSRDPYDYVQAAREEGASIVQAFHEQMSKRNGHLYNIISDVCAMANTNGGTIYIGVNEDIKKKPIGIDQVSEAIELLHKEIDSKITPHLDVDIDTQESQGKAIVRIQVPRGTEMPYAIDENKIYVRDETESSLAVRDEIVRLVLKSQEIAPHANAIISVNTPMVVPTITSTIPIVPIIPPVLPESADDFIEDEINEDLSNGIEPPHTGVEVIGTEIRNNIAYHTMRDLRNGSTVRNVTRASARRLWHYAILEQEEGLLDPQTILWHGDIGLIKRYQRGSDIRFDLVQRDGQRMRVYYGVTDEGMHGPWQVFTDIDDERE